MNKSIYFFKASAIVVSIILLAFHFSACKKSSTNYEPTSTPVANPISNLTSNPNDTNCTMIYKPTFDIDSVIGTYITFDTLLILTGYIGYTDPQFDTTISTLEIKVTARGSKMIQFDTLLSDAPKFSNNSYSLDTTCTLYSFYTSYYSYYAGSTYIYKVDVSFNKDTMYYKSYNSYFNERHIGIGIKRR